MAKNKTAKGDCDGAGQGRTTGRQYAEYTTLTRWIVLIAVMLGTVLEVLDTSIVNVAIPDMMGNLGATLDQISWVSTGYIIANVIILPLTGWLSAFFGRRRYLAGSMILFTVASFCCGTAHSLNALVFFRILQGAGGAALLSTAQATIMEIFPPAQLGLVQAVFGIGVMVGPTVGPTLGGWITDNYTWPWIFFINVPIGILAITLTLLFMHDSKFQRHAASRFDAIGIGFLAIGLGLPADGAGKRESGKLAGIEAHLLVDLLLRHRAAGVHHLGVARWNIRPSICAC